jgi:hypothetical protein
MGEHRFLNKQRTDEAVCFSLFIEAETEILWKSS